MALHEEGQRKRTNQKSEGVDESADPLAILERREEEADRDEMRTVMQIAFDAAGIKADMFAINIDAPEKPVDFLDDLLEQSPKNYN